VFIALMNHPNATRDCFASLTKIYPAARRFRPAWWRPFANASVTTSTTAMA
jgi:hypothetical protein